MDLRLYFQVIWRFRYLVLGGIVLAVSLTLLSLFRVSSNGVSFRQQNTWQATETVLLTQRGFPWGRTVFPYSQSTAAGQQVYTTPFADPGRFSSLAVLYAALANSDAVHAQVKKGGPLGGIYVARVVVDRSLPSTATLPLVAIDGFATSEAGAISVARRATSAFTAYITRSQDEAKIAPRLRILTQATSVPNKAILARGRRLTVPIVVFMTVLIATIGLAFILENLRPRIRTVSGVEESYGGEDQAASGRR
jgi:hypothetical protein